jgi:hypothetical protein
MTVTQSKALEFDRPPALPLRRFTVDEYHRLGESGILSPEDRVELLEGWIVKRVTPNSRHGATIEKARESISDRLPRGWRIRTQLSGDDCRQRTRA